MGYNLTIDQGNSTSKIVLWDKDMPVDSTLLTGGDHPTKLRHFLAARRVDAAIGCSVSTPVDQLLDAVDAPRKIIFTTSTPVPLVNDYLTPETLGVDRMAAAVGAATLYPGREILVADLGTACTFDLVTADGHYSGGNITPGVGMRLRALHHFTKRLPLVSSHADECVAFGRNTEAAMRAGAIRGVVAEVLYFQALGAEKPRLTAVTGGWSADIMKLLPAEMNIHHHKYLVNQGLNRILLYNETL